MVSKSLQGNYPSVVEKALGGKKLVPGSTVVDAVGAVVFVLEARLTQEKYDNAMGHAG